MMVKDSERKLKVFLLHSSNDKPAVREIYQRLKAEGWIAPWLDEEKILPGQDWDLELEKAVEYTELVVAFLSKNSVSKEGYIQRELRVVLNMAKYKPVGTVFIIPVRLDDCPVPRSLRTWQYVDAFPAERKDWAYQRLVASLRLRAKTLGIDVEAVLAAKKAEEKRNKEKERREKAAREGAEKAEKERLAKQSWEAKEKTQKEAEEERKQKTAIQKNLQEKLAREKREAEEQERRDRVRKDKVKKTGREIWLNFLEVGSSLIQYLFLLFNKSVKDSSQREFRLHTNPYLAGNPIDPELNQQMFFGRSDIVQTIYKEVKEPLQKPSLLLYGRRRMGKTSALLNLAPLMQDLSIVDIFISAQNSRDRTDSGLVFNLIKQIIVKLKEATFVDEVEVLFKNEDFYLKKSSYVSMPILVLSDFLSELYDVLESNNLYCLIMFDEYELLGNTISEDFFMQIRYAIQHQPRVVFLFSGAHLPNEIPQSNWKEIFMNVKILPISFLKEEDGYKLLTEPVSSIEYKNNKIIKRVLDITGCQPLMLQAMASEIVNLLNSRKTNIVTNSLISDAVEKVLDAWSHNFFNHIWEEECNSNQDKRLLVDVAKHGSQLDLDEAKKYGDALKKLKHRDLLVQNDSHIKLTMPIIRNWLARENHL